jgi:hypothetical protein
MARGVGDTQVKFLEILAEYGDWHYGHGVQGVFPSKALRIFGTLADRGLAKYTYTAKNGYRYKINAAGKKWLAAH